MRLVSQLRGGTLKRDPLQIVATGLVLCAAFAAPFWATEPSQAGDPPAAKSKDDAQGDSPREKSRSSGAAGEFEWKSLFDGKTLKGWKVTNFSGHNNVDVKDGTIEMKTGSQMTGITWGGDYPKMDYEISLEAQRVDGQDFFCGLTFPVNDSPCSLIVGGWGGGVVGLSSINGSDASENETTQYMEFTTGQWYPVRLRVTKAKIEAWIDGKKMVDVLAKDRKFSIRVEVELSKPLGIACWSTTAALRDIKLRRLSPAEVKGGKGGE